jgi:hypothetical protein
MSYMNQIMLRLRRDMSVVGEFPSAPCATCVFTRVLQMVSVTPLQRPTDLFNPFHRPYMGAHFSVSYVTYPQMFAVITANYVHKLPASPRALKMG